MYCMIFVACPSEKVADKIADTLLKKKLIACANIVPGVKSKYWWKGKIEMSGETLMMMKTKQSLFDKVEKEVRALHPYDVPEVICMKIDKGSKDYLGWVNKVTK